MGIGRRQKYMECFRVNWAMSVCVWGGRDREKEEGTRRPRDHRCKMAYLMQEGEAEERKWKLSPWEVEV